MGLSDDKEQIKRAVEVYSEMFPFVVGFKLYAGHSVGNLAVVNENNQYEVFDTLTKEGYRGVLAVHCEKEGEMRRGIWTPKAIESHAFARPEIAEIESVKDIIKFAKYSNFEGKLHIVHVSCPESVKIIGNARSEGIDLSCGVTPGHVLYDWSKMMGNDGVNFKMNPPLREPGVQEIMLDKLKKGEIDWLETDHAPHTLKDKSNECSSGIISLHAWPSFIDYLRRNNFSERRIDEISHENVVNRFGINIKRKNKFKRYRGNDYHFDPWIDIMGKFKK